MQSTLTQDSATTSSDFIPPEFARLGQDPASLTARAAERFGVTPETFINWRWQMRRQIGDASGAESVIPLAATERDGFAALEKLFHAGVTPTTPRL